MSTSLPTRPNRFSRAGFSLIEVVLAVGIMALGVVTILGLLPHGMEISRQTANELAEGRIVDTILGDLQGMDWANLNAAAGDADIVGTRFFDDQGLPVNKGDPDLSAILSYVAQVEIPEPNVYLPTNGTPGVNQNLRRVVIKVAATPLQEIDFENLPSGVRPRIFTQLVARTR